MQVLQDFYLTSVSGRIDYKEANPLGPLADLVGTWKGRGFNQIWRPFHDKPGGRQDRFLELNETVETLQFDEIPGDIPNRGFLQDDINLHGIRYLQQIQDANVLGQNGKPAGIHIEPGLWISTPQTSNPKDGPTVARMANIPHGTSLVAQGSALPVIDHAPPIGKASITPFPVGQPGKPIPFPEQDLETASQFRTPKGDIPNVTQAIVDDPNTVLRQAIANLNIVATSTLRISTSPLNPPTSGGGADNIAFLQGDGGGPNAQAAKIDAIFWIETVKDASGKTRQLLQYTQTVLLNFNGLSWPHVSVATLEKQ